MKLFLFSFYQISVPILDAYQKEMFNAQIYLGKIDRYENENKYENVKAKLFLLIVSSL